MAGISLVDTKDVQQRLSLVDQMTPSVDPEVAGVRAAKYDYLLSDQSPGLDSVRQTIETGNERNLQEQLALQKKQQDFSVKTQIIDGLVKQHNNGKPLSADQYNFIQSLSQDQLTNPDTIFETEYAKKVFSDMLFTNPSETSQINDAYTKDQPVTDSLMNVAEANFAKNELVRKKYEELQAKKGKESGPQGWWSFVQQNIPFFSNLTLQKDVINPLVTMGIHVPVPVAESLHSQYDHFRFMEPDQFSTEFAKRVDEIAGTNLDLAMQYVEGYMDESTNSRFWGNIGTALDYTTLIPFGAGAKGAKVAAEAVDPGIRQLQEVGRTVAREFTVAGKASQRVTSEYNRKIATVDAMLLEPGADIPKLTEMRNHLIESYSSELKDLQDAQGPVIADLMKTIKEITDAAQAKSPSKVLSAAGKVEDAAKVAAKESLDANAAKQTAKPNASSEANDLTRHIPEFSDPNAVFKGPFNLAQFSATRLAESVKSMYDTIFGYLGDRLNVERLTTDQAQATAITEAEKRFKLEANINDAVANVAFEPVLAGDNKLTNTYQLGIKITRPSGSLFDTKYNAGRFAAGTLGLRHGSYEVVRQGDGFYIHTTRPLDETSPGVRAGLLETNNLSPEGLYGVNSGAVLRHFRSADQLLSPMQNANRKVVIYGLQGLPDVLETLGAPIKALKKSSKADLNRFFTHLADDLRVKGPSADISNIGQFNDRWMAVHNRVPTEKETKAYFATRAMYNFDWMLRNIAAYRALSRQGVTEMNIRGKSFLGKIVDNHDVLDHGQYGVLVDAKDPYFYQRRTGGGLTAEQIGTLKEIMKTDGLKLVQVGDPLERPFKDTNGNIIHYVITKETKSKPLNLDLIPYDPSQVVKYDYKNSVVQPRINPVEGKNIFTGDSLIMHAQTAKEASNWAKALEKVRVGYKELTTTTDIAARGTQLAELRNYIHANLPFEADTIFDLFDKGKLNADHPIISTQKGKISIDNPDFKRSTDVVTDGRNDTYNIVRGVDQLKDENPILRLDQQKMLDPLVGISRGLDRMSRNSLLSDYQIAVAEQFVTEFKGVLETDERTLQANPIAALTDPKWAKNVDKAQLARAQNFQVAAQNLLKAQSWTSKQLGVIRAKLYESIYDAYGVKAADLANSYVLPGLTSPLQLARAATQHLKIGMFNPIRFFQQLNTFVASASIVGPNVAYKASGVDLLWMVHRMGKPEFLDHFDNLATKVGLERGDFKELLSLSEDSKLMKLGSAHIYNAEDTIEPGIITTKWGKFLDWGSKPWQLGDRMTRRYALTAAFTEWRGRNVGKAVTPRDRLMILNRADTLNINMTKVSQSAVQSGTGNLLQDVMKSALQFRSYQMRIWELMTGHTLTPMEKTRMFITHSAFYGLPVTTGALAVPWPWFDQYRQDMIQKGVKSVGPIGEIIMKGVPEFLLHVMTGRENDFNTAMGPPAMSFFHDVAEGDSTLMDMFLGASGSTVAGIVQTTYPLLVSLAHIGDLTPDVPLEDFYAVAKNVSSVNQAFKAIYAFNFGQAMTKNKSITIDNVTTVDGIMMSIFGISPSDIGEVNQMISIKQNEAEAKKYAGTQIGKYIRQMVRSEPGSKDWESNLKMARVWQQLGQLDYYAYKQILEQTIRDEGGSTFDRLNRQMLLDSIGKDRNG